jgi:hypothetical protein
VALFYAASVFEELDRAAFLLSEPSPLLARLGCPPSLEPSPPSSADEVEDPGTGAGPSSQASSRARQAAERSAGVAGPSGRNHGGASDGEANGDSTLW